MYKRLVVFILLVTVVFSFGATVRAKSAQTQIPSFEIDYGATADENLWNCFNTHLSEVDALNIKMRDLNLTESEKEAIEYFKNKDQVKLRGIALDFYNDTLRNGKNIGTDQFQTEFLKKVLGINFVLYPVNFAGWDNDLRNGNFDFALDIAKTKERAEEFDFSKNIYSDRVVLLSKTDITAFTGDYKSLFSGKKVATLRGSVNTDTIRAINSQAEIVEFDDLRDTIPLLKNDEISFVYGPISGFDLNYGSGIYANLDIVERLSGFPMNTSSIATAKDKSYYKDMLSVMGKVLTINQNILINDYVTSNINIIMADRLVLDTDEHAFLDSVDSINFSYPYSDIFGNTMQGRHVGVNYDIVEAISRKLGKKNKIIDTGKELFANSDAILRYLAENKLSTALLKLPYGAKFDGCIISTPIAVDDIYIIANSVQDASRLKDIYSLTDIDLGVKEGTFQHEYFNELLLGNNIKKYKSFDDLINAFNHDKVDYIALSNKQYYFLYQKNLKKTWIVAFQIPNADQISFVFQDNDYGRQLHSIFEKTMSALNVKEMMEKNLNDSISQLLLITSQTNNQTATSSINTVLTIFSSLLLLSMLIFLLFIVTNRSRVENIFVGMLACNLVGITCEFLSCYYDGNTFKGALPFLMVLNFIYYLSNILLPLLATHFFVIYLYAKETEIKRATSIAYVLSAIGLAFLIISQLNHMYYHFDANNFYIVGRLVSLSYLIPLSVIIINFYIIIVNRKSIKLGNMVTFTILLASPVAAIIIKEALQTNIYLATSAAAISLLFLFLRLQSDTILSAKIDPLTKQFNRRAFSSFVLKTIENRKFKRSKKLNAIFMFDLDRFKIVNDTYGHQQGDVVLVRVAQTLAKAIGTRDVLARYGGEEMILFCPYYHQAQAAQLAEKIRSDVQNLIFNFNDAEVKVTISIGYTLFSSQEEFDLTHYIEQADAALYRAKENGRNRVEAFEQI
jgi:diguanylate cyclase (GGDEF) domain